MKLCDCLDKEKSDYRIVRLACCLLVVYGHSFSLVPTQGTDLIFSISGIYAADIGIKTFFFLSGLLVVHSLLTKRKPAEYLVNRVLRIYPAFFVVIVLSAFMIGPMCTNLS